MTRYLMIVPALGMLACSCATSVGAESPMDKEMALLRQQNAALHRMVAMQRGVAPQGQPGMVQSPPSARRHRVGPPQEWAWMHQRPEGCESGPLAVEFQNFTFNYIALFIDGRRMRIRGADGELPAIPPRTSVYACLQEVGTHQISGIAYVTRYGELREIDRFDRSNTFYSTLQGARGTQWFPINKDLLRQY